MKKKLSITLLLLVAMVGSIFASSVNSSPAATVNLIRNKVITRAELQTAMETYSQSGLTQAEVLDILINDEVFLQGAERDGITVSDTQLDSLYSQQKSTLEQQYGVSISQADFEQMVVEQYGSIDEYKEYLKNQYILQAYLMQEKGDELNARDYNPTDAEITAFYRRNQTNFVISEYVRFSDIYVTKTGDSATDLRNRNQMNQVAADIKAGRITYEAAVNQYSEDEESKPLGGDMGYLMSSNTIAREGYGDAFVDTVLGLPVGQVSNVLESNIGYHIPKVTYHQDAKMLGINDRIDPNQSTTVYQYIQQGLAQQNMNTAANEALDEMLNDLKAQARIRKFI